MANVLVNASYLTEIADAIRSKTGGTDTYTPAEMADAIEDLSVGGITPTGTLSISANGTYDVTEYASAEVAVPTEGSSSTLTTKTITANGTYSASDDSADGYSSVTVNVESSGEYSTDDILNRIAPAGSIELTREVYAYEFYKNTALTGVTGSVTKVGAYGFQLCTALESFESSASYVTTSDYMFGGCTSLTTVDATLKGTSSAIFDGCTSLTSINQSNITSVGRYFARNCTSLTTVTLSGCTAAGNDGCFSGCTALTSCTLSTSYSGVIKTSMFENCSSLPFMDCGSATTINARAFYGCTALTKLVLRRSSAICSLANVNAFTGTPFASGGTGGTIYVPSALISTYQTASNWSTLYGYGTVTFVAIEGSDYE